MRSDMVNPHYQQSNDVNIIPSQCSVSQRLTDVRLQYGVSVNGEFILNQTKNNVHIHTNTPQREKRASGAHRIL